MKKRSFTKDIYILLSCFLVSRMITSLVGVSFGYEALYEYWQYLDVRSLKTNLLQSLWYLHAQPPVFNLLLGIVLKAGGSYTVYIMEIVLLVITCCNGYLLLIILRKTIDHSNLPLICSLLYILSPATILLENELFYTTFISLLMLVAVNFFIRFGQQQSWLNISGMFTALSLVCLTRSMYHLLWLIIITGIILPMYYKKASFKKILLTGSLAVALVGGWYLKNYFVFDNFAASSWVGFNFSRIVFHNVTIADSNNIASVPPFMPMSFYKNFITINYKNKYSGLNDPVLLSETKNDRYINMNNAGYLEISKKYLTAGIDEVSHHPLSYIHNACTAFIIFFTPASSYFKVIKNNNRIGYYDMIYSFNPAHLFKDDYTKKQSLVVAAIPKFLMYALVFFLVIRRGIKSGFISLMNIFIITTILFSLTISTLLDYGENMRFRYEIEPLFLLLSFQVINSFKLNKKFLVVGKSAG